MSVKDSNGYCGAYRCLESAYLERFEEIATSAGDVTVAYGKERERLIGYLESNKKKVDLDDECSGLYVALRTASHASFHLGCEFGLFEKEILKVREGEFTKFKMGIFF